MKRGCNRCDIVRMRGGCRKGWLHEPLGTGGRGGRNVLAVITNKNPYASNLDESGVDFVAVVDPYFFWSAFRTKKMAIEKEFNRTEVNAGFFSPRVHHSVE